MFQDVKTVLHIIAILFIFSKQMVLLSRRKGRRIQASNKDSLNFRKAKYLGYGCIGTFGMIRVVKCFSPKHWAHPLCTVDASRFR